MGATRNASFWPFSIQRFLRTWLTLCFLETRASSPLLSRHLEEKKKEVERRGAVPSPPLFLARGLLQSVLDKAYGAAYHLLWHMRLG